jgi:hypothetical protein
LQLFHHKAENPRAPDRRGTVCSTLSSLSCLYTTLTYCLHYCCCCCSPPREQNNDNGLLPPLIPACPGVGHHLAHPVDSAASSLLVNTVILPSSVFTLARPESCQNPQRRQTSPPAFARAREVPTCLVQVLVAPAIRIEGSSRSTQAHQLPRQRAASSPRTFAVHSRNSDIPQIHPSTNQGQGALSYFVVAHLPASPQPLLVAVRPKRSPTASHPTPADWPGESWHYSTLLLAPANALTSTVRRALVCPPW